MGIDPLPYLLSHPWLRRDYSCSPRPSSWAELCLAGFSASPSLCHSLRPLSLFSLADSCPSSWVGLGYSPWSSAAGRIHHYHISWLNIPYCVDIPRFEYINDDLWGVEEVIVRPSWLPNSINNIKVRPSPTHYKQKSTIF